MTIRFQKYKRTSRGDVVQAIRLTDKNVAEVVAYVNKNGGKATNETVEFDGHFAVKVGITQRVWESGRIRKRIRKAFRGDFIVRNLREDGTYEFWRIRDAGVNDFVGI